MVATTLAVAAGSAVVTKQVCKMFRAHSDPKIDAGIKAAAGLGLILGSTAVKNEYAKGAMMGAGVGAIACAAGDFVPFLA